MHKEPSLVFSIFLKLNKWGWPIHISLISPIIGHDFPRKCNNVPSSGFDIHCHFHHIHSWWTARGVLICQNHVLSVLVLFEFQSLSVVLQDESGNVEFPWVVFVIELLDNFVVIFFTFEFAIRLVICPNKRRCFLDLKKILSFIKSVFKSNLLRFIKYIFE